MPRWRGSSSRSLGGWSSTTSPRATDARERATDARERATDALEAAADLPEVGEDRLEQRSPEVLDPGRAAGPALRPDRPLDHLDVAIAPLLEALVEVDEPLRDQGGVGIASVDGDQEVLDALVGLGRKVDVARQDVARKLMLAHRQE